MLIFRRDCASRFAAAADTLRDALTPPRDAARFAVDMLFAAMPRHALMPPLIFAAAACDAYALRHAIATLLMLPPIINTFDALFLIRYAAHTSR